MSVHSRCVLADGFLDVCSPDSRATLYHLRVAVHRNARTKGRVLALQDFSDATDTMEPNRSQWPRWVAPLDFGDSFANMQARVRGLHAACFPRGVGSFSPWPMLVAHANRPEPRPAVRLV